MRAAEADEGGPPVSEVVAPGATPGPAPEAPSSLSNQLLREAFGSGVLSTRPVAWYRSLAEEERQLWLVALGAALLFFPLLGAVGLWDPWEPHYAEVGREMMVRHDWIHPFWESAYFFSKPPLTMWLTNLGLLLSGSGSTVPHTEIGLWTEWGVRTPNALLSILAVVMLYLAAGRIFGRRVGLLAALACATMPLYDFFARQAATDMPFVALLTSGLCCFMIAEFDAGVKRRERWLYAFYGLIGLSTLAKEIPFGFGVPGGVVLLYILLTWDWALLKRVRLVSGGLLCLAIAVPWVLVMSFFRGLDDESKTFAYRYWIHDNFDRFFAGVHTTTPNTSFVYFVEQLGYGMYPWSALIPGALISAAKIRPSVKSLRAQLFVAIWALLPFFVVSMSATKFHHYAFPCLPPLAILVALFVEQLWLEGLEAQTLALLLAGALFAMIGQNLCFDPKHLTDMFVYNYDRPYPTNLIADATPVIAALVTCGTVAGALASILGGNGKARLGGAVALAAAGVLYLWIHLITLPKGGLDWAPAELAQLAPRDFFALIFVAGGALSALAVFLGRREWFIAGFAGCAIAFACYLSYVHWEQLSPNWSQRDVFHTYFAEKKPGETIAAYYMNWRGETFYSKNDVQQIKDPEKLRQFIAEPSGPESRHWIIVEQARFGSIQQALGDKHQYEIRDDSDNKFFLVLVD
jgi:4-amino-4-deoxy-L-arabinose transferase-like glycosyltransferase